MSKKKQFTPNKTPLFKQLMSYITPIILLFIILNLPIFMGGIEVWFGWNFIGIINFVIAFIKVILFLVISKALLEITGQNDHPLVLAGIVLGIIVMFLNSYYTNYQLAFYQKITYGKAFEIDASELHLKKDLHKTPYVKIRNTNLDKIKFYKKYLRPDLINYITYCYADILNTKKSTVIINQCSDENRRDFISIKEQYGKSEITVLKLPKKHDKLQLINSQQFFTAPKTFEAYYQSRETKFISFIKVTNGIGILFSFIFLYFKIRQVI